MSPSSDVSEVVLLAPELPHDFSQRLPRRSQSWLPIAFKCRQETDSTHSQGFVWTGLSFLNQAACLLLWFFCLHVCLRGHDISALHPHTLKASLVALGTLLFIVCTRAAYLRSIRLRRDGSVQPKSRGTILPCSSSSSKLESRPVELANKYSTVPGPAGQFPLPSSKLHSRAVESADEYTTISSPAGTIRPCSSSPSSSSSSRLCSNTVDFADKYAAVPVLPLSIPFGSRTPDFVDEYTAVPGPSGTTLYCRSSSSPPASSSIASKTLHFVDEYTAVPGPAFSMTPVESADKYNTVPGQPGTIQRRWRRSSGGVSPSPASRSDVRQVDFAVKYTTVPGEKLFVVGSSMELGAWDVNRSVPMEWRDGNIWTAKVAMNAASGRVEYKYVVRSDQKTTWENSLNHIFDANKVKEGVFPFRLDVWGIV